MTSYSLALLGVFAASSSQAVSPSASPEAAMYRALGTEPFWSVRIEDDRLYFDEANAPGVTIEQPVEQRAAGNGWVYSGSARIKLWARPARCSDGMSDRVFPDEVIVQIDNRRFEGCGGKPVAGPTHP